MIHIDDGVLRAWLDQEHPTGEEGVAQHVDRCADCRARVRELRRAEAVVGAAVDLLDGPVPTDLAWARVAAATRGGPGRGAPVTALDERPAGRARGGRKMPLRRAAVLALLCAGGVAAATLPGSPLRTLWTTDEAPAGAAPAVPAADAPAAPLEAGIRAVDTGAVDVALTAPAGTAIEVTIGAERAALLGPPTADFSAGEGWLRAVVPEGPVRIELSRGGRAEIRVNDALLAVVEGGRFARTPEGASVDDDGATLRFVVR